LSEENLYLIIFDPPNKGDEIDILTVGNSAKLYCLNWIEQWAREKNYQIKILDLGCGVALNFVNLLKLHPQIRYIGIEPSKRACLQAQQNLKELNATVINSNAYKIYEKFEEKFDIVVSFSVFEHVYKRKKYLFTAKKCLKNDGYFLINYDAGHFLSDNIIEKLKNILGPILSFFGIEKYYQSFVKEKDFIKIIEEIGFKIIDAKFFNSNLKGVYKIIPRSWKKSYMEKWLEFELWLNEIGINYNDSMARFFGTRNFILTHKD